MKKSRKSSIERRNRKRRQVARGLSVERLDERLVLSGVSPIAHNDVYSTSIDTPLTISVPGVLSNDTDAEGDALSASIFSSPAHGTLSLNTDGSFNYAPAPGFTGFDSFTYRANDGTSFSKLAAVTLKIFPANAQPMLDLDANDSSAPGLDFATTFTEDGGPVSIVDTDPTLTDLDSANLQSLTVTISNLQDGALETLSADTTGTSIAASYAGGVLTLTGSDTVAHYLQVLNSITYQNASQNPNTTPRIITFVVNDGDHTSDVAATTLNIVSVNDAPASVADAYTTSEDTALNIAAAGVLSNDTDAEGNSLSALLVTGPTNGTLTLNADGSFNYTPNANYHGIDTFTYKSNDGTTDGTIATVTITVESVNDLPVAGNDNYETNEDSTLNIAAAGVLTNDTDGDGGSLTAVLVSGPTNGTLTLNADGSFSYTPAANFNGPDSFTYQASDGTGLSTVATVNINVKAVNDVPLAENDAYDVDEDGNLTIPAGGVLGNDSDLEGSPLSALLVSGPMHGSLTLNADGSFTYTPNANYNGIDGFSYVANDGSGDSDVAAVTITVNPINDVPVAGDDSYTTDEDTALVIAATGVLANDTDIESDPLSAVLVTGPANGSVTLNADGSFTYTPNANFNGSDSFTYKANDGSADSNVATVSITVNAVNDVPVVGNDSYTTDEDTALTIAAPGVLGNDSDVEGSALSALLVTGPTNGTLTLNADGSFVYTPNPDFNGTDGFSYKTNDGTADSDVAAVTITVNAVNDIPTATDDSYSTSEDTALTIATAGVLTNDTDPESDPLSAVLVSGPTNGTLTLNADGSFLYTPGPDFNGADSFTYKATDGTAESPVATVTITVNPVNDLPVASDDAYATDEDTPLNITAIGVLSNDADIDGDTLSSVLVSGPANGTLTLNADGSFLYTPNANFNGTDSFVYKANDGSVDSNEATVTITVASVNDLPTGEADSYTTDEDTVLTIAAPGVLTNDSDLDGNSLTAALVTGPANGSLTLNADGSFSYTPNANFNGTDSFTYKANDGTGDSAETTVTITVNAVNDLPTATEDAYAVDEDNVLTVDALAGVLSNDSDVDGNSLTAALVTGPANGSLTLNADGSFSYTPNANFNGTDSFTYKANDGTGDSAETTVTITVNAVNDLPTATEDAYAVDEDNVLTVDALAGVLSNDSDVDGNSLTAALVTGPANGSLTLNADGSFSYTPNANFNGTDSFTYKANDGTGDSAETTVTITVNAVNDLPVAENDSYTVDEDNVLNVSAAGVLGNDTDVDGDPITATLVTGPMNGTLTLNADGSFVYTPNPDFNGTDGFSYMANDGTGDSTVAAVTITVNPVNDLPTAVNDEYTVDEDNVLTVAATGVLGNDTDVDGNTLTSTLVTGPLNGTLTLNADGSFVYTPNPDFNGIDGFTYVANDGTGDSTVAAVTITVNAVNDLPVAGNDNYTVDEDTVLNVSLPGVLANDIDADGDPLTAVLVTGPLNGTLSLAADGSFVYTPNANFFGTDGFSYMANDGTGDSTVAAVTITVNSVNDVPLSHADHYSLDEDGVLNAGPVSGVLRNDFDIEGDTLSANLVSGPSNGTLTLNPDGSYTYTPNANFFGPDTFVYKANDGTSDGPETTVTITVNPVNDAPVANNDVIIVGDGVSLSLLAASGVLDNDTDIEGDELSAILLFGPFHGTMTMNPNGTFDYTPNPGFVGEDTFYYQAFDGEADSDVATATLVVAPVEENSLPEAADDAYSVNEDGVLDVPANGVMANDADLDGDPLSALLVSGPSNGTVTLNADGSFTYTPNPDFKGADSFTYKVNDGTDDSNVATVNITVNAVVGVPVAENDVYTTDQGVALDVTGPGVLVNDSDSDGDPLSAVLVTSPLHGTLTLNTDGSFSYVPNPGFSGVDAFSYQANDGGNSSDVASVTITINPVNTAPVAKNDRYNATESTPLVISAPGVLANDLDANGDPMTVALFTNPANGTVALAADGSFVYTPNPGFVGTDSFTYRANDGTFNSFVAAVTIDVSGGVVTSEGLRLAGPANPPGGEATSVAPTQLSALVAEAISRWLKAAPELDVAERLGEGTAIVTDLPGNRLGQVQSGQISVDIDAGGQGWFIDATPQSDEEFTDGVAGDGSPAAGRVDLLTTLMHEMGHLLGLHDLDATVAGDDLMSVELTAGVRKDPAVAAVDSVFGDL